MKFKQKTILLFAVLLVMLLPLNAFSAGNKETDKKVSTGKTRVTFFHYFSGTLSGGIDALVKDFNAENPKYDLVATPVDHEAFKTSIRVMLAGGNPPDLFSYWAGARVKFLVDAGQLAPIDDVFKANDLNKLFSPAILKGCTYNGKKYFLPLTQHFVAFFYNKAIFDKAGVKPPKTWDEFLNVCEKIKATGIKPIALGSKNRWPAQFWLDYLLLRTAGPEYRARLMNGKASYTDPEVENAMGLWKSCFDKGYFVDNPNAYDWAEAATMVGKGQAAMTLMGTWFMQLDKQIGWKPGVGYDYFRFPDVKKGMVDVALGPFDGVVLPKDARNPKAAKIVLGKLASVNAQATFNKGSGALAPNKNVSDSIYNKLQLRIKKYLSGVTDWAFNYDLATPPPVADVGLNAFSKFVNSPDTYKSILVETQKEAQKAFSNLK